MDGRESAEQTEGEGAVVNPVERIGLVEIVADVECAVLAGYSDGEDDPLGYRGIHDVIAIV